MCLAIPAKIIEVLEGALPLERQALVDFGGVRRKISLMLTPDAVIGDIVLVHVGFAISTITQEEYDALESLYAETIS